MDNLGAKKSAEKRNDFKHSSPQEPRINVFVTSYSRQSELLEVCSRICNESSYLSIFQANISSVSDIDNAKCSDGTPMFPCCPQSVSKHMPCCLKPTFTCQSRTHAASTGKDGKLIPVQSIATQTRTWQKNDAGVPFLCLSMGTLSDVAKKDSTTSGEYKRVAADIVCQIRTAVTNLRYQYGWA